MPFAQRDVAIFYRDTGRGAQTVLFCHGAGGNSASWWQQIPAFAERYRCLAMDHRGFGLSRCGPDAFRVEAFADDALAVLDAAGVEDAHFVCQSMGGWTGVQVALRQPQRIRSLVLADTIGGIALPAGIDSMGRMDERAGAAGAPSPALAADYPRRNPAGAFLYEALSTFNDVGFGNRDALHKLFDPAVLVPLAEAARLCLPTLIVASSDDLIWPPEVLRELATHLPAAKVAEVSAGHSAYFENPQAFNRVLRDFLDALDA